MQAAISQELGVPLSSWQKANMQEAIEKFPKLSRYDKRDQGSLFQPQELKHLARTTYNATQRDLAASGYKPGDKIRLYRGVRGSTPAHLGEVVNLEQNAASSWSIAPDVARGFSEMGSSGFVLAMDVPIESIFSTARTGLGVLREGELIVLGVPGAQSLVIDKHG